MPNRENISSSIFLELLLAVSGETVEEKIIEKILRLYLRKLDCFAVAIYTKESDNYISKSFLPSRFKEMSDTESVLEKYIATERKSEFYVEEKGGIFHYFFKLYNYGLLYLARRKDFSDIIIKEFLPIVDNLGKSLSFAKNIRLREIAEQKTSVLVKDLNLFKNFIQITQDAVQVSLTDGSIFYLNDTAAVRLGIPSEDVSKYYVWDFEPYFKTVDDWKRHVEEIRNIDNYSIESTNYNVNTKEKTAVEVTVKIKKIDGVEYIIAVSRDISERKKSEEEVLRREKMLLAISDATNFLLVGNDILDAISESLKILGVAVDVDRAYLFTNTPDKNNNLFSSQRFEWNSGNALSQLDNPELQNIPLETFDEILEFFNQRKPFVSIVSEMGDMNGLKQMFENQRILSIVLIPIFKKDYFWGFVGFDDCTSEKKWSEAEVSILKTFVSAIQNALDREEKSELVNSMALFPILNPNPVIRTDLFGNIILENAPAEAIRELVFDELPLSKSVFLQKIASQLNKNQNKLHLEIFEKPNRYFSLDCMLLEGTEQVNFYFNDITELKENERLLKEAKTRAEISDKAKEEFIANMSHEIRTPLHAITGLSKILKKSDLTEDDQKLVGHIARSGDHLHSLINNILDFSKISAGEFQVNHTTFSFRHLVKQLNSILHNLASEKGLELVFDLSPNIYELLIGDETSLRQVLLNLLNNSLKFTEKGSVSLTAMPVFDSAEDQELEIKIIDTGIGMSDEFLNRIFDKFSQEDSSLGRKYGGTGLGMAITKKLVHLMGGTIIVSSQKNVGTTFCIRLPLKKNIQKIVLGSDDKGFDKLSSKKILVVEDNDINLLVARTVLSYHGLTIFEAKNGLEAINHPEIKNLDLILMDLQMPKMDGFAATEYIKNELKLEVPIIALTANAVKTEIDRCFELGMVDYVLKPFNEIHLLDVISTTLNLKKQLVVNNPQQDTSKDQLYDLSQLIKLSNGSNDFLIKIVSMFIEQIPDSVQSIKNAFEAKDYEKTKAFAHKIKATYIQFGVKKLEEDIFLLNYFDIHSSSDLEKCKTAVKNLFEITELIKKDLKVELALLTDSSQ